MPKIGGEEAVAHHDVARGQAIPAVTKPGRLAGRLAPVRADRQVTHGRRGQADDGHQRGDGKAQAGLLGSVLGQYPRVLLGVGPAEGGPVDPQDATPLEEPIGVGPVLQDLADWPGPSPAEADREALPGLANGAGLGRARGLAASHERGDQPGHGGSAGVVGAEDLAEEGPEGHARGEAAVPPADTLLAQGVLDRGGVDQAGEESGRVMAE